MLNYYGCLCLLFVVFTLICETCELSVNIFHPIISNMIFAWQKFMEDQVDHFKDHMKLGFWDSKLIYLESFYGFVIV